MPTYDYQCRSCGTVTEVIHSMTEDGPTVCDRCGGELRRVLYPAGIIFKGSGFYRTDSRSSDSSSVGGKKSKDAAASSPGSTGSSGGSDGSASGGAKGGSAESSGSSGSSATGGSTGGESAA